MIILLPLLFLISTSYAVDDQSFTPSTSKQVQQQDLRLDQQLENEMQFLQSSTPEQEGEDKVFEVPQMRRQHFEQNDQRQAQTQADEKFLEDEVDAKQAALEKEKKAITPVPSAPAASSNVTNRRGRSR